MYLLDVQIILLLIFKVYFFPSKSSSVDKACLSRWYFLSHVRLFATPWTVAYQAPRSMGFSKQEYWSMPFPSPGDLSDLGIEPGSPAL